jgi:Carboxypeptidase Taq (M32) metallopeptidase
VSSSRWCARSDQPPADDGCLHRSFGEAAQLGFGLSVAAQMGYDLERGRLDKTHHPFCTKFAAGDVRITTRVRENDIRDALFSTRQHNCGTLHHSGKPRGGDLARSPLFGLWRRTHHHRPHLLGGLHRRGHEQGYA